MNSNALMSESDLDNANFGSNSNSNLKESGQLLMLRTLLLQA